MDRITVFIVTLYFGNDAITTQRHSKRARHGTVTRRRDDLCFILISAAEVVCPEAITVSGEDLGREEEEEEEDCMDRWKYWRRERSK